MSAPTGAPSPRVERDAAALAESVAAAVADTPPLTPDQISRVAVLLRPTSRPGSATTTRAA